MAHIVQFRVGEAREAAEPESSLQGGARIIIFPGVRRERHVEADGFDGDCNGPERDWLQLPD
ncbi:MAG: hypothetical protein J2P50_12455 [Hyphomicrobiaceae bacterium]|nr:hypothetical protein [Hyphomicrobiaceae bacterium]